MCGDRAVGVLSLAVSWRVLRLLRGAWLWSLVTAVTAVTTATAVSLLSLLLLATAASDATEAQPCRVVNDGFPASVAQLLVLVEQRADELAFWLVLYTAR